MCRGQDVSSTGPSYRRRLEEVFQNRTFRTGRQGCFLVFVNFRCSARSIVVGHPRGSTCVALYVLASICRKPACMGEYFMMPGQQAGLTVIPHSQPFSGLQKKGVHFADVRTMKGLQHEAVDRARSARASQVSSYLQQSNLNLEKRSSCSRNATKWPRGAQVSSPVIQLCRLAHRPCMRLVHPQDEPPADPPRTRRNSSCKVSPLASVPPPVSVKREAGPASADNKPTRGSSGSVVMPAPSPPASAVHPLKALLTRNGSMSSFGNSAPSPPVKTMTPPVMPPDRPRRASSTVSRALSSRDPSCSGRGNFPHSLHYSFTRIKSCLLM